MRLVAKLVPAGQVIAILIVQGLLVLPSVASAEGGLGGAAACPKPALSRLPRIPTRLPRVRAGVSAVQGGLSADAQRYIEGWLARARAVVWHVFGYGGREHPVSGIRACADRRRTGAEVERDPAERSIFRTSELSVGTRSARIFDSGLVDREPASDDTGPASPEERDVYVVCRGPGLALVGPRNLLQKGCGALLRRCSEDMRHAVFVTEAAFTWPGDTTLREEHLPSLYEYEYTGQAAREPRLVGIDDAGVPESVGAGASDQRLRRRILAASRYEAHGRRCLQRGLGERRGGRLHGREVGEPR